MSRDGYARVSTLDQNPGVQRAALKLAVHSTNVGSAAMRAAASDLARLFLGRQEIRASRARQTPEIEGSPLGNGELMERSPDRPWPFVETRIWLTKQGPGRPTAGVWWSDPNAWFPRIRVGREFGRAAEAHAPHLRGDAAAAAAAALVDQLALELRNAGEYRRYHAASEQSRAIAAT